MGVPTPLKRESCFALPYFAPKLMPDPHRAWCKRCGRHKSECGPISWTGQCNPCACDRVARNLIALGMKSGLAYHRWRRATAAGIGAELLDDDHRREVA